MKHIVFIINNRKDATTQGIRAVLECKTNEFTNEFLYTRPDENITNIVWNCETKCILIKETEVKACTIMPENIDGYDIVLIDDRLLLAEQNNYPDCFKTADVGVVFHRNTNPETNENITLGVAHCVKGQHEKRDTYYGMLVPLFAAYKNKVETGFNHDAYVAAKEAIFAVFDSKKKLNLALELLHSLLCGIEKADANAIEKLKSENIDISSMVSFTALKDNTTGNYNQLLVTFRDELLKAANME